MIEKLNVRMKRMDFLDSEGGISLEVRRCNPKPKSQVRHFDIESGLRDATGVGRVAGGVWTVTKFYTRDGGIVWAIPRSAPAEAEKIVADLILKGR